MLLLLLRRGSFGIGCAAARSAAAAASASAARGLLQFAGCGGLRLLLGRTLRLLRTWSARLLLLLLLLWTFAVALPLLLAIASRAFVALALALARASAALVLAAHLAGALLVLADLLLHEPPRLLVETDTQLVMTAVRTALPSFGIGLLAAGAEDGFRERHR